MLSSIYLDFLINACFLFAIPVLFIIFIITTLLNKDVLPKISLTVSTSTDELVKVVRSHLINTIISSNLNRNDLPCEEMSDCLAET